jgi:aminoglycoside/choline kinase family phosphotransferase
MSASGSDPVREFDRIALLQDWLSKQLAGDRFSLEPASNDASFRRYFRVRTANGASLIAMDAPPALENCEPFIRIAKLLGATGVNVPALLGQDTALGFLLLSDLGTTTYLEELLRLRGTGDGTKSDERGIDSLYLDAMRSLVTVQLASRAGVLPEYDRILLERELRLFPDWYVQRQLCTPLSAAQTAAMNSAFESILNNNLAQAQVFVHRDYHSRNLMVCEPNPGILDFQDAVHGPVTYDLVSLLRDAYIEWDEERVIDWCIRYWELARRAGLPVAADFAAFYRDFEWMGVQRQIKVVGIFARLAIRDGKQAYLRDQPLVMRYLLKACGRYRELAGLARLIDQLQAHSAGSSPQ